MQNFAECMAGKGKFCGRIAAASCAKNYGDRIIKKFEEEEREREREREIARHCDIKRGKLNLGLLKLK